MFAGKKKYGGILLVILLLLLLAGVGAAAAKYVKETTYTANVTFTAELAKSVVLQEHVAVQNTKTGAYTLSGDMTTTGNNYQALIPGVDVPKDPHIVIEKTTGIGAYLYIEVVDTLDACTINDEEVDLVGYTLMDHWVPSGDLTPKHAGKIYKYTGTLAKNTESQSVYILENNSVTVSQYVKSYDIKTNGDKDILAIYAYLVEASAID